MVNAELTFFNIETGEIVYKLAGNMTDTDCAVMSGAGL
jgi:hypothetical protein